ncbi:MAG: LysR family transcriptional regulator [Alphaproteobacteria bacterium]|nr:LysR family transcriptional regulator [Alphaproteobacteria bacterium]
MKLSQFRDVVAVAERGSLRAAARHLGAAQPALSRSIHELERELGVPLFERRARGMVLTPMGDVFVRRAAAVLGEVRRARDEIEQLQGGLRGSVVAALSSVPHMALLPSALRPFRTRYANVRLRIVEGVYPAFETALKDGSIDCYIGPSPGGSLASELVEDKLFDNARTIIGRTGHPLAKARSLKALVAAEWAWAATSITHDAEAELAELFTRHRLPTPRLALAATSALTLMVALMNSDLLAMVPIQWTRFALTARELVPIRVTEAIGAPPIVAIRRAGLPLTPAAEFFVDLMRRAAPGG